MSNFWKIIKKPIVGLSPMDGVTDFPMREIQCQISKPSVVYTEFISVEGFVRNPLAFQKKLFFKDSQRPIVCQLFGYSPIAFFETILRIIENNFDGIDLNMGCPAKSVLKRGGGGALIGNYKLVEKIILKSAEAIKKSKINIPLSIKTRIGKYQIITDQWIKFLSEFSISEISIHGRLLKQENSGPVNWEEIQKAGIICNKNKIICLGNGGIKSFNEAKEKTIKYNLDGVLIGQAALGNPWVFKENYQPSREEIFQTIIKHAELVEKFYPSEKFVTVLKHLGWYPRSFPNCVKLKTELLKTRNLAEVKQAIANFG